MRGLRSFPSPQRGEDARRADEGDEQRSCEAFEHQREAITGARGPLIRPDGHLLPEGRRGVWPVLRLFLLLAAFLAPLPAFAVNPDEVLADPAMETRARTLSAELRCMVCQNQSIDDSNAELAKDLRLLVRERITDGDSDEQVLDYIVSRYGEFVLLKPRFSIRTVLLWGAPVVLILAGGISMLVFARRRVGKPTGSRLTADEQAKLDELLSK